MIHRETGQGLDGTYRESDLKVCDLCGALNLAENGECFVCGWHGRFETRPELVHMAMEITRRRFGRLDPAFLTGHSARRAGLAGLFHTLRTRIASLFRRGPSGSESEGCPQS